MASESPAKTSAPSRMPLAKVSTAGSCAAPTQGVRGKLLPVSLSTLDETVRAVVQSQPAHQIADALNANERQVYRWATTQDNESGEHRHLPVSLVVPLTRATGRDDIVRWLAEQAGYVLVPMPQPIPGSLQLLSRVGALTRELAEVQQATADALSDGLTAAERKALVKELGDVLRAASGLLLGLQQGAA